MSRFFRDIEIFGGVHKARRTAAIASLKVNSDFVYQAAALGWINPDAPAMVLAQMVMRE
jgi:hypothetical protein